MPHTTEEQKSRYYESNKKWREKNKEKLRQYRLAYYANMTDEQRQKKKDAKRKWYTDNYKWVIEYNRRWRAANPEKALAQSRRSEQRRSQVAKVYPAFGEMIQRELSKIDIYAAAKAALPQALPKFIRDDVITDIVIAHLEGTLAIEDVASKAKDFLRAYNHMFDQWRTLSLDAAIPGTEGKVTYLDRLAMEIQD